jgi:hypothetical protein
LEIQRAGKTITLNINPLIRKVAMFDDETGAALTNSKGQPLMGKRSVLGISLKGAVAPMSAAGALKTISNEGVQTGAMILQMPQQVAHLA